MQSEIRRTEAKDFPEVDMFISLHNQGELKTAAEVSDKIWTVLDANRFKNGETLDLRDTL